jgi:serine/threonine protein kinase
LLTVLEPLKNGHNKQSFPSSASALESSLRDFQGFIDDIEAFLKKNLESTSFYELCQVDSRRRYCDVVGEFNKRLNQLLSELSGILSIRVEDIIGSSDVIRSEDFDDLQSSFVSSMRLFEEKFSIENAKEADRKSTLDLILQQQSLIQSTLISIHGSSSAITAAEQEGLTSLIQDANSKVNDSFETIQTKLADIERQQQINFDEMKVLVKQVVENTGNKTTGEKRQELLLKLVLSDDKFEDLEVKSAYIAKGGFGSVHLGRFRSSGPIYNLAVKVVERDSELSLKDKQSLENELLFMSITSNHINIVKAYGYYHETSKRSVMVMELAKFGSVWDVVNTTGSYSSVITIPFHIKFMWVKQLLSAIKHIHGYSFIHKDIKSENCLLFDGLVLKLGDFGLTKDGSKAQATATGAGTFAFMAPELIKKQSSTVKSDLYAWAMTFIQIFMGCQPSIDDHLDKIVAMFPDKSQDHVEDKFKLCWLSAEPSSRDSVERISRFLDTIEVPEEDLRRDFTYTEIKLSSIHNKISSSTLDDEVASISNNSLKSPPTTQSASSISHSNPHVAELINWFTSNVPDVTLDDRVIYAEALVALKITSIERFKKLLLRKQQ